MSERAEVLSMSELFRGRFFNPVADHTGWRWKNKQVDEFISDLSKLSDNETLHLGTVLHKPHPKKAIVFGGLKLTPHTLFDGYQRLAIVRGLILSAATTLCEIDSPMAKMQSNSLQRQFGIVDGHERLQQSSVPPPDFPLPFPVNGHEAHDTLDAFINRLSRQVTVLFYATASSKKAADFVHRQATRGIPSRKV